jgi:uncharacterized membrane protein
MSFVLSALFFIGTTWTSYARWANYEYRTFDLAFYVQGIWQFLHGRFDVSVLGLPLLGNHVEPIVFLFAPLFAIVRHPLVFVAFQNLALAWMGPIAFRIGRRLGLEPFSALLAAAALLICPATGYIALHEFHPEALSAPLLLLMFEARLSRALARYWTCFLCVLACKENMALLLAAYCVVQAITVRPRDWPQLRRWYLWPLLVAAGWFCICICVITPALNRGGIEYLTLYNRLGNSVPEIVRNFFVKPQLAATSVGRALVQGNLLWALLLCFAGLPLLRPRWLLIALPVLLQHLLSWRSSEWSIYFHYAAPILPLFWMASVEALSATPGGTEALRQWAPAALLICTVAGQALLGPIPEMAVELAAYPGKSSARTRKDAFVRLIPKRASVVAPLPYLSHLAMRERLYSLHFILKGLKTLSHQRYQPPAATDYVLIDYADEATFDASAGYYHPPMRTKDGDIIPSSDDLLRQFLDQSHWASQRSGNLLLLTRTKPGPDR